jgi:hypothetical protein
MPMLPASAPSWAIACADIHGGVFVHLDAGEAKQKVLFWRLRWYSS